MTSWSPATVVGSPRPRPSTSPPCEPTKIVCVHLNYESRRAEFQARLGPAPTYFHKPVSSLNAHGGAVVRPPRCRYLNYEGEIAIVIGRVCRGVAPSDAGAYIGGYTVANDYGLHDFRDTDAGSMLRVKGSDTLCPLGPGVVDDWDFHGKRLLTRVNGEVVQDGNTDEMIWDMHYLVADIARTITLVPGDVILSGTPANSRPVQPGDVVEVEVEGLGTLRNRIVEGITPIRDDVGAQPSESEEGDLDRARRRLGVPRDPAAEAGLSVATVRYLVRDVGRAVDFYAELLGFAGWSGSARPWRSSATGDLGVWLPGRRVPRLGRCPTGGGPSPAAGAGYRDRDRRPRRAGRAAPRDRRDVPRRGRDRARWAPDPRRRSVGQCRGAVRAGMKPAPRPSGPGVPGTLRASWPS